MHTLNTDKLTHAGSIYIFVIIPNVLNFSEINYLLERAMHINQTKAYTSYFIQQHYKISIQNILQKEVRTVLT